MSPFICLCPGDSQPVFFQLFLVSFLRFHRRIRLSPPLLWYLLRDFTPSILLAPEAPNTFNASIHTFYLDGVDIGYPCFHDICSAIPEPNGCVLFHLFIRLVSSCDYLRPEHRHLEKVSAKNCSLSPKQSHANSAFNETPVNRICCHFEFFN